MKLRNQSCQLILGHYKQCFLLAALPLCCFVNELVLQKDENEKVKNVRQGSSDKYKSRAEI